jgi:hypothetical protein
MFLFTLLPRIPAAEVFTSLLAGGAAGVAACRAAGWRPVTRGTNGAETTLAVVQRTVGQHGVRWQGRIPLPVDAMMLVVGGEAPLEPVDEFIDRLARLPRVTWLQIGRALQREESSRSTARLLLEATIADQRLGITAWNVRDGVDTAAYYAGGSSAGTSRDERYAFAAAHGAAEGAALAFLVRNHLAAEDVAQLQAPFACCLAEQSLDSTRRQTRTV